MSTGTGVDVSKLNAYTVSAPPVSVDVSKVNAYSVAAPVKALNVSKIVAYTVVSTAVTVRRPVVQCCG